MGVNTLTSDGQPKGLECPVFNPIARPVALIAPSETRHGLLA